MDLEEERNGKGTKYGWDKYKGSNKWCLTPNI